MIVDQLFTPKLIKEGEVYDLGREYGAPPPEKKKRSQDPDDHNPYPFSPEEDEDYFREIFRKKREAKAKGQDVSEDEQLDEVDWKAWQNKMKAAGKGAKEFTKNVRDTGNAAAGMINAYGGAGKELGQQLIARPVSAAYNATKSGLSKAADVAKGTYGDVKQGAQNVGRAVDTVATDAGNAGTWAGEKIKQAGRGAANVAGGTAGALGSVVGGATTGLGRAGVKGFNTGVQNVGGDAVDRAETNIFKPKSDPVEIKKQIDLKKQEIADLETELKAVAPIGTRQMPWYGMNAQGTPRNADQLRARGNTELVKRGQPNLATSTSQVAKDLVAQTGGSPLLTQPTTTPAPVAPTTTLPTATTNVQPRVTYGPGFNKTPTATKPAVPNFNAVSSAGGYKPAAPATTGTKVTAGGPTPDEMAKLNQRIAQASKVAEALANPVAEMLQMVETKDDVYRIKQFVDQTFAKYGAVNESAFEVRNKIIEHVTQVGAQRRREFARKG